MSSAEDRLNRSAISAPGQKRTSGLLQMPGFVSQLSPTETEQSPFPEMPAWPAGMTRPLDRQASPSATGQLPELIASPGVTRNLPAVQTGPLLPRRTTTTALRQPVVIPATGKKSSGTMKPPRGRSWVIQAAVTVILVLIAISVLLVVAPAGLANEIKASPFQSIMTWAQGNNSNPSLLAMQAATVTAVTVDGYQPSKPVTNPSLPSAPPGVSGYDGFTFGQCTYWADYYYHELSGFWVPWGGNADQWAAGAQAYGWNVSSTPHVPSIIVLQPYVQGASAYGHVAVVTAINSNGSVTTSNMNWYANGGGWDRVSTWTFNPGSGVSFVWK